MPELSPYCATCQKTIEIRIPDLDEPVTAKCGCSGWVEGQQLPDWWCMTASQANAIGGVM